MLTNTYAVAGAERVDGSNNGLGVSLVVDECCHALHVHFEEALCGTTCVQLAAAGITIHRPTLPVMPANCFLYLAKPINLIHCLTLAPSQLSTRPCWTVMFKSCRSRAAAVVGANPVHDTDQQDTSASAWCVTGGYEHGSPTTCNRKLLISHSTPRPHAHTRSTDSPHLGHFGLGGEQTHGGGSRNYTTK